MMVIYVLCRAFASNRSPSRFKRCCCLAYCIISGRIMTERSEEEESLISRHGNGKSTDNINVCPFVAGDCDFKKPFSSCGYTQGRDDELDWEQIDTSEKPSLDPWVPPGETLALINHWSISGGSCLIVACWQSFICTDDQGQGQASQWASSHGTDWKIYALNFIFFLLYQNGEKNGGFFHICYVNTQKNHGPDLDMLKVEK